MALELIGAEAREKRRVGVRKWEGRGQDRTGEDPVSCCYARRNVVHKLFPVVLPELLHHTPQKPPRMSTLQGCAAFEVLQGSRESVAALTAHIRGLIPLNVFHLERLGDSRDHKVLGNHLFVFLWPQ